MLPAAIIRRQHEAKDKEEADRTLVNKAPDCFLAGVPLTPFRGESPADVLNTPPGGGEDAERHWRHAQTTDEPIYPVACFLSPDRRLPVKKEADKLYEGD